MAGAISSLRFAVPCIIGVPCVGAFFAAWLLLRPRKRKLVSVKFVTPERRNRRASETWNRDAYSMNPMNVVREPVVIAMVGLPARGKSYLSKAILRYLTFLGCPVKLFNAGNKRRDKGLAGTDANFFDANNADAKKQREQIAMETLDELLAWLRSVPFGCACGIFDATNTTVARRREVMSRCAQETPPVRVVFLESLCNDERILKNNYQMKLENDDYKGADAASALQDFMERVHAYEKVYQPITDEECLAAAEGHKNLKLRYVQTINAGQRIVASRCDGFIMSQLMPLLHSIHLGPRKVSIVLAGESQNDRQGFRGGDSSLSESGLQYARVVSELIKQRESSSQPAQVWTGTLRRYSQFTDMLSDPRRLVIKVKVLDELCFGSLEGLACGYLRESFPEEHAKRQADKFHYRYPGAGGESYMDLIMRLRDCVQAMERVKTDAIVICDVAVARALLGYYQGIAIQDVADLNVHPGIIELTRSHSGFQVSSLKVEEGDVSLLAKTN